MHLPEDELSLAGEGRVPEDQRVDPLPGHLPGLTQVVTN